MFALVAFTLSLPFVIVRCSTTSPRSDQCLFAKPRTEVVRFVGRG